MQSCREMNTIFNRDIIIHYYSKGQVKLNLEKSACRPSKIHRLVFIIIVLTHFAQGNLLEKKQYSSADEWSFP